MSISVINNESLNPTEPFVTANCQIYNKTDSTYSKINLWRPVLSSYVKTANGWKLLYGNDSKIEWIVDLNDDNASGKDVYFGGGWDGTPVDLPIHYFGKLSNGDYLIRIKYSPPEDGIVSDSSYEPDIAYSAFLRVNSETGEVTKFCSNEVSSGAVGVATYDNSNGIDIYLGLSYGNYHYAFGGTKMAVFKESTGDCVSVASSTKGFNSCVFIDGSYAYGIYGSNIYRASLGSTSCAFTSIVSGIASGSKLIKIGSYLYVVEPSSTSKHQRILKYGLSGSLISSINLSTTYTDTDGTTKYKGVYVHSIATDGTYLYLLQPSSGVYHEETENQSSYYEGIISKYNGNLTLLSNLSLDNGRFVSYTWSHKVYTHNSPIFYVDNNVAVCVPATIDLTTGKVNPHTDAVYFETPFVDHWGYKTSHKNIGWNIGDGGVSYFLFLDSMVNSEGVRTINTLCVQRGYVSQSGSNSYNIWSSPFICKLSIKEVY